MGADLDVLLVQLQDGRSEVRTKAARALAADPDPFARKPLLQALKDKNPEVRYWSVVALASMLDAASSAELLNLMQDSSRLVRLEIIRALGKTPGPALLEPLLERLGDPDEDVRLEAARVLSGFKENFFKRILAEFSSSNWNRRYMVFRSMLMAGQRAAGSIGAELRRRDQHREARYWLIRLAGEMRLKDELPVIQKVLEESEDEDVLAAATMALSQIGGAEVLEDLIRLMEHSSPKVREAAMQALGNLGEHAISLLIERLDDESRIIRLHSAEALSHIGDVTITPLIERFYERDKEGRFWILSALRKMHLPFTLSIFKTLCHEEDSDIQLLSIQALGDWQGDEEVLEVLLELLDHSRWKVRAESARSIARLKPDLELLVRELEEGSANRRYWVIQIFEMLQDPRSIPALIRQFSQDDWVLRTAAAEALNRMGDLPREMVLQELESGVESRVFWMTRALSGSRDRLLLDALLKALHFRQSGITANVTTILRNMGDAAWPRLSMVFTEKWPRQVYELSARILSESRQALNKFLPELMQSSNRESRFWAVHMASTTAEDIQDVLHQLLENPEWQVRLHALKALGTRASAVFVPRLLEMLEDEYPALRREAVLTLGPIEHPDVMPALLPLFDGEDLEMKLAVIQAMGSRSHSEAAEFLLQALQDPHWLIQREVLRSLTGMAQRIDEGIQTQIARSLMENLPLNSQIPDGFFREWLDVAKSLGQTGLADSIRRELPGENLDFTIRALRALKACEPRVADGLQYLKSPEASIRHLAIEILAASEDEAAIEPLKKLLSRSDPGLRAVVRSALRHLLGAERWASLLEEHVRSSREEQADRFHRQALDQVAQKNWSAALKEVNRACALSGRVRNQSLKARILAETGAYQQAESVFLGILRERPEDLKTLYNLAMLHFVQGHYERTQNLFDRLEQKQPPEEMKGLIQKIRARMD